MMPRVDRMRARAQNCGQKRIGCYDHLMHWLRCVRRPHRVLSAFDVLNQCSAVVHVKQLQPAADAQHGEVAIQRLAQQTDFHSVARGVGFLGLGVALLSITAGVQITPTGDH